MLFGMLAKKVANRKTPKQCHNDLCDITLSENKEWLFSNWNMDNNVYVAG